MPTSKKTLNKRALIISLIIGVTFSVLNCIGYAADKTGELMVKSPLWWLCLAGIAVLMSVIFYLFLISSDSEGKKKNEADTDGAATSETKVNRTTEQTAKPNTEPASGQNHKLNAKHVLLTVLILLICWLPVFLAEYPGFFVYDATDEYVEVATRTFSTHHPLLHVLLLGGSVCAGNKIFGNYNAGIALYTLFQMIVVSTVFGWITVSACNECTTEKKRKAAYVLQVLWYGLFPTVVMFVLCSAKDTLFSAFMMIAVVMLYRIARDLQNKSRRDFRREASDSCSDMRGNSRTDIFVLAASLILMMLMRHNGVYGVLVLAVITLIFLLLNRNKSYGPKRIALTVIFFVAVIGCYKPVDFGLAAATHADTAESQEMLTVPIQQIARCWRPYKSEMTEEEKNAVLTYIPEEALDRYTPNLSDPVKMDFNNKAYAEDKSGFIKIWLELMKKHPLSYINAWIDTSYGFYYPWTVVNVYEGHEVYTFTYDESSYFGYEVEQPGERHSLIPAIDSLYRWLSLDDDIQRIPVLHLLFSMGALFWVYAFAMALFIYKKNYAAFTALSLPAGVWLTLLLGPTFLPRYTVFLWFLLPVCVKLAVQTYSSDRNKRIS